MGLLREPGCVALTYARNDHQREVLIFTCEGPHGLAAFGDLITHTFIVFYAGQPDLACLAEQNIFPQRLGTVRAALSLLAQGERGTWDLQTIREACERSSEAPRFAAIREEVSNNFSKHPPPPSHPAAQVLTLAQDAACLLPLVSHVIAIVREESMIRAYELETKVLPAVVAMQETGIYVDVAHFEQVASSWKREVQNATEPAQIARLNKLHSTYRYWARDYADRDSRIRTCLNPLATDSGRFSSSSPNLQQVPSEHTAPGLRHGFRAQPGYRLIIADYAQIELRVAAHLAPCDQLRRIFLEDRDPHRASAATLTGKPENEISAHERKLAKAINFGFLFGMGAAKFKEYAEKSYGLSLSAKEAEEAREAFFTTFPGIAAWHRKIAAMSRRARSEDVSVSTILGRKRRFPAGKFSFAAALNIPVQGSAAEGFKRAMIDLHRELPRIGARGVLCIHDEYLAEAPIARAQEACDIVKSCMESAMHALITSVPIRVQAAVVDTWGDKD
jgi:DNA polymerase-1